jgi:hypothetical protein
LHADASARDAQSRRRATGACMRICDHYETAWHGREVLWPVRKLLCQAAKRFSANRACMAKTNKSAAPQPAKSRPLYPMIAVAVFLAAGIAFMFFGRSGGASTAPASTATATPSSASPAAALPAFYGRAYPMQGHAHMDPGTADDFVYNSNPPTSGPHREIFTDVFLSPSPLPAYIQVHLLEHGNVLLQYSCKCPDVADELGAIAMTFDNKQIPADHLQPTAQDVQNAEEQGMAVVVAPYPKMKSKIALTAWTRLATLNAPDQSKILSFINTFLHNSTNTSQ